VGDTVSVESLLSLRAGLQAALFRLGKAPKLLQIDNSSAATHQISGTGKRDFNPEFLSLVAHYGLTPRTIHVGWRIAQTAHRHLKKSGAGFVFFASSDEAHFSTSPSICKRVSYFFISASSEHDPSMIRMSASRMALNNSRTLGNGRTREKYSRLKILP
jgi:hypothetical protein